MLTVLCASRANGQNSDNNRPNIILILADDLGYGDVSAYGGEVETPNIDRLAEEGLRFTDFHTNGANCSPTRAALITGRYQQRVGIESALGESALGLGSPEAEGEITMAQYLQGAGYKTGIIGKWHLGYYLEQSPIHFGFDRFVGMLHGATDYHSHINTFGRFDWWHNDKPVREEGYVTDLISNHTVHLLDEWQNNPFFLFVSHLAIHFPWQTPEDEPHRVEGKIYRDVSGPLNRLGPHPPEKSGEVVRVMIEELDKSVGLILDKVYELGLEKETLIIFTSDNGGITEYSGGYTEISSNGPLRGAKHSLYEGGHRVPAIAWWQGKINAGTVTNEIVLTMDLLPTFLELADINQPDSNGLNTFDGMSITPMLFNSKRLPSRTLFWRYRGRVAVRSGDWKMFINLDGTKELYFLANDIGEKNNIAEDYPNIVEFLSDKAINWINDVSL